MEFVNDSFFYMFLASWYTYVFPFLSLPSVEGYTSPGLSLVCLQAGKIPLLLFRLLLLHECSCPHLPVAALL